MRAGRYRLYVCDCGDYSQFPGSCLDCGGRLAPLDCISVSKIVEARDSFDDAVVKRFVDELLE